MERLTYVKKPSQFDRGKYPTKYTSRHTFQEVVARLSAYEDTGLGPEEITTEPYGCVFYCNRKCNLDGDFCAEGPGCSHEISADTAKHLLELAQAEKDGRLVVLPPNDPLTLEELREMDGEPVWGAFSDGCGSNMIIQWHNSEFFKSFECGFLLVEEYGKSWLAYRRKPEEATL